MPSVLMPILVLAGSRTLWVSPAGNDANSGLTPRRPFATISRAAALALPGDTVNVGPGVYRETVRPARSGTVGRPIRYVAQGPVTLSGADRITGFAPLAGGVSSAPMPWSFTDDAQSDQLFEKGRAMNLARWPKTDVGLATSRNARVVTATDAGTDRIAMTFSPAWDEPDGRWAGAKAWVNLAHLGSNWGQDGQAQTGTVVSTNRATGTVVISGIDKRSWNGGVYNPDQPWGIGPGTEVRLFDPTPLGVASTGGPASLLGPGEWWRDAGAGVVHVRPRTGSTATIEARKRSWAFDLSDRSYVSLDGFGLFATSVTTDIGAAARLRSVAPSHHLTLRRLRGRYLTHFTQHTGDYQMMWIQKSGIRLSGTDHLLEESVFEDVAGPAVSVIGRRNRVLGNTIRRANYEASDAGCIDTGQSYDPNRTVSFDHEIGWNTIEDSPSQGVNMRGLQNSDPAQPGLARIHHNSIRNVMTQSFDSAALDQFGTDGGGVRIDHNAILDMPNSLSFGIYVDYGSGYVIDHNFIANVEHPIHINNHNDGLSKRIYVDYNTVISSVQYWRQPGVQNGGGNQGVGCSSRYNLSTLRATMGPSALEVGNVVASDNGFVDLANADFRTLTNVNAGAWTWGDPRPTFGAASYPFRSSGNVRR